MAVGWLVFEAANDFERAIEIPTLIAVKWGVVTTVVCGVLLVVLVVNVVTDYACDRASGIIEGDRALVGTLLDGLHGTFEGTTLGPLRILIGGER